jgi:hypothetical protein
MLDGDWWRQSGICFGWAKCKIPLILEFLSSGGKRCNCRSMLWRYRNAAKQLILDVLTQVDVVKMSVEEA